MPPKAPPLPTLEVKALFDVLRPRPLMGHYLFSPNGLHGVAARPRPISNDVEFVVLTLPSLEWRTVSPPKPIGFGLPNEKTGLAFAFNTLSCADDGAFAYVVSKGNERTLFVLGPNGEVRFTRPDVPAYQTAFHPQTGALCVWATTSADPYTDLVFLDAHTGAEQRRQPLGFSGSEYKRPGLVFDRVSGDALTLTKWVDATSGAYRPVPWSDAAPVLAFHDRSAIVQDGPVLKRFGAGETPLWTTEVKAHVCLARSDASEVMCLSCENASTPAVVTRIDGATGAARTLDHAAQGRLSSVDQWYHWPANGPAVFSARGRVSTFDPTTNVLPDEPLDCVGATWHRGQLVTAHDDGLRWWSATGALEHVLKRPAPGNDSNESLFSPSPDGKRLLVSGRSGVLVLEGQKLVWAHELMRRAAWVDEGHVAFGTEHTDRFVIVDLSSGAQTTHQLGSGTNWSHLGRAPEGVAAASAILFERFSAKGERLEASKVLKSVKGYGAVTQLETVDDATWVLSKGRLFSWKDGACSRQLSALDKVLGFPKSHDYAGSIVRFALNARFVVLGVSAQNMDRIVVVDRASAERVAESAPLPTVSRRFWVVLDDASETSALVCVDQGVVLRFAW